MLKSTIFSTNNSKLNLTGAKYRIILAGFDILAGYTCPFANVCHSRVYKDENGKSKIKDFGTIRCYAASAEALHPEVYTAHKRNTILTKSADFVTIINWEINRMGLTSIRVHTSGDFYSLEYAKKWIKIARLNPSVMFWGYTKNIEAAKLLNRESNMKFIYSIGGLQDSLYFKKYQDKIPSCRIIVDGINPDNVPVACPKEDLGNDYEYIMRGESFGIVVHGTQKAKVKNVKVNNEVSK